MGVGAIGIICVILFLLCFSWTKERVTQIESEENVSVKQDLKNLFHNAPWWILVATGLAALLFNAVRDSVAIYFFRDYVKVNYRMAGTGWDMTTIYFLVGQAANLIGVMAAPAISRKIRQEKNVHDCHADCRNIKHRLLFHPEQHHLDTDFSVHDFHFCRICSATFVVDVCRYCGSPGITYRPPCDWPDFLLFLHVAKTRLGFWFGHERMDFGRFS